ncbi:MAG: DHA2 family efflux MFS transporter permease subunit [Polyangiales bacterium]
MEGQGQISGSKVGITVAVMLAALMALLDISIVNVALSDIRASFGTPLDQIAWVSTGYMMANVVVIPMTGWLQRRFGYRKYFAASILIFTAASALCGMAWNLPSLVAFRILQGMGGGAIIPTAQAILFARYPKKEHGMAGALFGLAAVTGPLLGPTAGGYLIDWMSWHWIFLINVPVGLFACYMVLRHVEEPNWVRPTQPIDTKGIALLAVGMAALQYVLEEGNREDWFQSGTITLLAAVAAISLVTFIVHQLETEHPIVDLRVFKQKSYTAATMINFLLGTALFGAAYLFSLFCGAVLRYSAKDIGQIFLYAGVVQIIMMPIVGKLVSKVEPRAMIAGGIFITAYSLYMTSHLTGQSGFWDLTHARMVMGAGMSLLFIPLSVVALSDVTAKDRGNATGLFNLTRELGGSIGTAWMGMQVANGTKIATAHLSESVTPYSQATNEQLAMLQGLGRTHDSYGTALSILQLKIGREALVITFAHAFSIVAIVFAAAVVWVTFLGKADRGAAAGGLH